MDRNKLKRISRARRKRHIRKKFNPYRQRPRLNVFRSSRHIYAQIIDDMKGETLVQASSLVKDLRSGLKTGGNIAAAEKVGELIARKALDKGIKEVVFDRSGYLYHGRVKTLAQAARQGGLKF
ncbi:MAG: 50S ribosomal protein L18 [Deltaproteobacteria bacterium]|nr:MAG: 50S ribosomal protein L18 [Deltaproteobacteria bacterium]